MNPTKDKISVIIVNYNTGDYLTRCVSSAFDSIFPIEIHVIDNASSDQSIALLKQKFPNEPRLHIIENKQNSGFACANNSVIPQTQGEYLLLLNPDCYGIPPSALAQMKAVMDEHADAGMAGCLVRNADGSIQPSCVRVIPNIWNSLLHVLRFKKAPVQLPQKTCSVAATSGAFMFVRRAALNQVGLMDENYFLYCEDTDWMLRFQQAGWRILFVPGVEIFHAKGVSGSKIPLRVLWYKHRGMLYFYRKFYADRHRWFLNWLVYAGVVGRLVMLSLIALLRRIVCSLSAKFKSAGFLC